VREGVRETLLDEVARGVAALGKDGLDGRPFWSIEVTLLAPGNVLVRTAPLALALGWIVGRLRVTEDGTDITAATTAHVHIFEMRCPTCQAFHENEDGEEEDEDDDGSAGPAYLDDQDGPAPEPRSE
jgi:hypothetical protein